MEIIVALLGGGAIVSVIGNIILFGLQRKAAREDKKEDYGARITALEAGKGETNEELQLLTYGILACLKGLKEQGCNGPVTDAVNKIEKHLNERAHGG